MTAYQGLKILDCSQGRVGPMAAMLLGDFGAEVLKVEPPGGDRAQASPGYQMWNRNKARLTLDVDTDAGLGRLEELLAAADVAVFDHSPRRMETLDLMDAAERHLRLVRLWTPPYGTTGLWSEYEAHHGMLMAITGGAFRQSSYRDQPVYLIAPVLHYAQATMAAGSVGAALLERARSGLGQAVTVSGLNAVALVGGASGLIMPIGRRPLGASPSYRTYECGDGQFLFLATLFSYFFQRALNAMGLTEIALAEDIFPEDVTEAMEARFREKPRDEWLEILRAADVPAGPVCRREDWLGSQLIANNDMRVVLDDPQRGPIEMPGVPIKLHRTPGKVTGLIREAQDADVDQFLVPAAGGDVARTRSAKGPLTGIKVLDMGTVIAGAYASAILANLGADVVKVESADGDPWRDRGIGFTAYNRGKRGLVIDLKHPEGRAAFLDLARQADVVLDNYRLGVRDRLGVGHKDVLAANPRAISCSVTTYGSRGEETKRPGFDPLLQARSGLMAAQGGDNDEPVFHIIAVNDFASAAMAAFGVITALNAREATGEGQGMETSLTAQSAMFQSGELTTWPGAPPASKGSRDCLGVSALDRFYECADGWVLIACRSNAEGAAMAEGLGHPEWATAFDMMSEPRDGALAAQLDEALATMTVEEALTPLIGAGVRATYVRKAEEILNDRWLWANDFFDKVLDTPHGQVTDRPYADFSRSHSGYRRPEPGLGEHSFEVLADYGFDPDRIARLADAGGVMCLS
jgi:crotonobetainyl-CoA:carnitine CoA-transferase CaiB-like acyl-CoA transferase